jgi:hypothetical protein
MKEEFVVESHEMVSEFILSDGTVLLGKPSIRSIHRVDGQFDDLGKPIYAISGVTTFIVKSFDPANGPVRN